MNDFETKLKELQKDLLLGTESWGGLSITPGVEGTLITKKGELYSYHQYYRVPSNYPFSKEGIQLMKTLTKEELESVHIFINKYFATNTFEFHRIFDATFKIRVMLNQEEKVIINAMQPIKEDKNIHEITADFLNGFITKK